MNGTAHRSLNHPPGDLIGAEAAPLAGDALRSHNPARPNETIWEGSPITDRVDQAVAAARRAFPEWSRFSMDRRLDALRAFQRLVHRRLDDITALIRDEVGKAQWEAQAEAKALAAKVDASLDESPGAGLSRVQGYEVALSQTRRGVCRFRPHGVMVVIGPFNFPMHLPNGHIVPALAMGDTVVFKPSEKTPAAGQLLGELFNDALREIGAPPGVVNVVQGGPESAVRLVEDEDIDGIAFTGSWPVGRRILEANLDRPGRIIALEMGGNNPAVVMDDADLEQAVIECARASFATAGQRCTCTRRIIVHERVADRFIAALARASESLRVGEPASEPPVFMGPMIRAEARDAALRWVDSLQAGGGEVVLAPSRPDERALGAGHYITPGIVRVGRFRERCTDSAAPASRLCAGETPAPLDAGCDEEMFGPVVRVASVGSLDEAIEQANATRYGLAASIFTTSDEAAERFLFEARAGCVNVNMGTAGASSKLPFGGLGLSGNHRPAAAFAFDYCAHPVASMIEKGQGAATSPGMTFDKDWLT